MTYYLPQFSQLCARVTHCCFWFWLKQFSFALIVFCTLLNLLRRNSQTEEPLNSVLMSVGPTNNIFIDNSSQDHCPITSVAHFDPMGILEQVMNIITVKP